MIRSRLVMGLVFAMAASVCIAANDSADIDPALVNAGADIELPDGVYLVEEGAWKGGFRKKYWNESDDFRATAELLANAMRDAGFESVGMDEGSGWGEYGGREAWGTRDGHYVKASAIIAKGSWLYVCSWPDDNTGSQCF